MKKDIFLSIAKSITGGLSICLGTVASKYCPYPALAPLLFAVGIFMVMQFDWNLITRHIPTGRILSLNTIIILFVNLLVAYLFGLCFPLEVTPPDNLFWMSVAGGAVIGLVSLNNLTTNKYKIPIAILLMYIFVMLGLPHCVVYAFLGAEPTTLLIVVLGNIVGGILLRLLYSLSSNKLLIKK